METLIQKVCVEELAMSDTETLRKIQASLEPKPIQTSSDKSKEKKDLSAVDFTQALLELPKLMGQLKSLVDATKHETDYIAVITKLDADIQKNLAETRQNLKETQQLKTALEARVKQLEVSDAMFKQLMTRVSTVLDGLEKLLR